VASIQAKLFALTCALSVVLVGFFTTYVSAAEIASARRTMESKARTYAQLVSARVESGERLDDRRAMGEVFAAVAQDHDVLAMALYESGGRLAFAIGDPTKAVGGRGGTPGVRLEHEPDLVRAIAPVVTRGGSTGTLVLALGADRLAADRIQIRRVALAVGATALAIAALGAWAIGRSLARRLRIISKATYEVANGDLSNEPIEDRSADEVGQLARSFGAMRVNLKELVDQIQAASELEKDRRDALVRERTRELEMSMERYKTLVESTNAIPWEMDRATLEITYMSPQAKKILGIEFGEANRSPMWQVIHADDRERVTALLKRLGQTTRDVDVEYRIVTPERRIVEVRTFATCDAPAGVAACIRGVTLDVTRQKRLEFELHQAQKLEAVGRLAAGVAHEINTPIQFVTDSVHFLRDATADLIRVVEALQTVRRAVAQKTALEAAMSEAAEAESAAELPYLFENMPKALERSLEGLGRVTTIVRSMKVFAHPDSKEMTTVDLNQAIESTLTIARSEYKYVAELETDFGELPAVSCHAGEVNQAFLNIVVNAAHAIGDVVRGTDQKGRIVVRTRCDRDHVVISIADTGGGIPENARERIFDPFFTTKEVGKGTGQGLAISRSVVDRHGGELTFETEMGKGTTFTIRLPVGPTGEGAAAAA
jgi:PAS domain S-box-containing protein